MFCIITPSGKKSLIKELIGENKTEQKTKQGSEFSYF